MKLCLAVATLAVLSLGATLTRADSLTVQLTGVSVSDGQYYVLPYELSIDGVTTDAICYDALHEISMNQIWQANADTLDQAANTGEFSSTGYSTAYTGYEEAAWLGSQWFTGQVSTPQQQIDLQYMIWDVYDPTAEPLNQSDPYIIYLQANEAAGVASLNTADFTFLEPVPDDHGNLAQAFLLYTPGNQENPYTTPESGSWVLVVIGAVLIGVAKARFAGVA